MKNERFPRSSTYDAKWLSSRAWGANPLWLCEWLTEQVELEPGMRVLDLGCGSAKSSVFLAREFGVQGWATDLWVPAQSNLEVIREAGIDDRVFPIHADARSLPFAHDFFDAVVAIDSYQYYGNDDLYLSYVTPFLRDGGAIAFASAGLARDFEAGVPPHLQRFWGEDTWCVHTLEWWRAHWSRTSLVDVVWSGELKDGWRHWLTWAKAIDSSDWYVETIAEDAGRYLGYVAMVGRKRAGARPWHGMCPHGCDAPADS